MRASHTTIYNPFAATSIDQQTIPLLDEEFDGFDELRPLSCRSRSPSRGGPVIDQFN